MNWSLLSTALIANATYDTHYTIQNHNHYVSQEIQRWEENRNRCAHCTKTLWATVECIRPSLNWFLHSFELVNQFPINCWPLTGFSASIHMVWTNAISSTVILSYLLCVYSSLLYVNFDLRDMHKHMYVPQNNSLYVHCSPFKLWMLIKRHFVLLFSFFDRWYFIHFVNVSFGVFFFASLLRLLVNFLVRKNNTMNVWPAMATAKKKETIFWFVEEKKASIEYQMMGKKMFKIFRLWFVRHIIAILAMHYSLVWFESRILINQRNEERKIRFFRNFNSLKYNFSGDWTQWLNTNKKYISSNNKYTLISEPRCHTKHIH